MPYTSLQGSKKTISVAEKFHELLREELTIKFNFPFYVFIGTRGQAIATWVNSRMRMARLTGLLPCWRTYVSNRNESERLVVLEICELTSFLFVLLLPRRSTIVDLFAQIMVVMPDDSQQCNYCCTMGDALPQTQVIII
jgi:hypothetical protein